MSLGDVPSLVAGAMLVFALAWLIDSGLREEYRAARAFGVPRIVAIPAAVVAACLNGC